MGKINDTKHTQHSTKRSHKAITFTFYASFVNEHNDISEHTMLDQELRKRIRLLLSFSVSMYTIFFFFTSFPRAPTIKSQIKYNNINGKKKKEEKANTLVNTNFGNGLNRMCARGRFSIRLHFVSFLMKLY